MGAPFVISVAALHLARWYAPVTDAQLRDSSHHDATMCPVFPTLAAS